MSEWLRNVKEEDVCKELGNAILSGNCILLTGLGFGLSTKSCIDGDKCTQPHVCALYREIYHRAVAKKLVAEEAQLLFDKGDLETVGRYFEEHLEEEDRQACLSEALSKYSYDLRSINFLLAQIPFRAYITTSYDMFFEDAYESANQYREITKYYRESLDEAIEAYQKELAFVLKLHGDVDKDNSDRIILSNRAVSSNARSIAVSSINTITYPDSLRHILLNANTLFIGFAKVDPDLEELKGFIVKDELVKSWIVVPEGHISSKEAEEFWKDKGICTIEYATSSELTTFFKKVKEASLQKITVYTSYLSEDQAMRDELRKRLEYPSYPGLEINWKDNTIGAGQNTIKEIKNLLKTADVILLLVSMDYLDAIKHSNIGLEIAAAAKRDKKGEARVIPVILHQCPWQYAPFAKLEPANKKAISDWSNLHQAYMEIAEEIKRSIEDWAKTKRKH